MNGHGQVVSTSYAGSANYGGRRVYGYDAAGRLVTALDTLAVSGVYTTRTYAFDKDSNRTGNATYGAGAGGACQSSAASSTVSHVYDAADRLLGSGSDAGLVYDAFGRITTLPAADVTKGGAAVSVAYMVTDRVQSQSQAGVSQSWTVDAAGRLSVSTSTAGGGSTSVNHYAAAGGDSPSWIAGDAAGSTWTRNVTGLDGNLVATVDQAGGLTWQIGNLHDDIAATATAGATDPENYFLVAEYGVPLGAAPARYGALGAKQRSTDDLAGLTLMGARLYAPGLGRFLSTDPVPWGVGFPVRLPR